MNDLKKYLINNGFVEKERDQFFLKELAEKRAMMISKTITGYWLRYTKGSVREGEERQIAAISDRHSLMMILKALRYEFEYHELMVGNIVDFSEGGYRIINEIRSNRGLICKKYPIKDDTLEEYKMHRLADLHPVALNEEWLNKYCELENKNSSGTEQWWTNDQLNHCYGFTMRGNTISFDYYMENQSGVLEIPLKQLEWVHQFQNLMKAFSNE